MESSLKSAFCVIVKMVAIYIFFGFFYCCRYIFDGSYNYISGGGSWYGEFVGKPRDIFSNTN